VVVSDTAFRALEGPEMTITRGGIENGLPCTGPSIIDLALLQGVERFRVQRGATLKEGASTVKTTSGCIARVACLFNPASTIYGVVAEREPDWTAIELGVAKGYNILRINKRGLYTFQIPSKDIGDDGLWIEAAERKLPDVRLYLHAESTQVVAANSILTTVDQASPFLRVQFVTAIEALEVSTVENDFIGLPNDLVADMAKNMFVLQPQMITFNVPVDYSGSDGTTASRCLISGTLADVQAGFDQSNWHPEDWNGLTWEAFQRDVVAVSEGYPNQQTVLPVWEAIGITPGGALEQVITNTLAVYQVREDSQHDILSMVDSSGEQPVRKGWLSAVMRGVVGAVSEIFLGPAGSMVALTLFDALVTKSVPGQGTMVSGRVRDINEFYSQLLPEWLHWMQTGGVDVWGKALDAPALDRLQEVVYGIPSVNEATVAAAGMHSRPFIRFVGFVKSQNDYVNGKPIPGQDGKAVLRSLLASPSMSTFALTLPILTSTLDPSFRIIAAAQATAAKQTPIYNVIQPSSAQASYCPVGTLSCVPVLILVQNGASDTSLNMLPVFYDPDPGDTRQVCPRVDITEFPIIHGSREIMNYVDLDAMAGEDEPGYSLHFSGHVLGVYSVPGTFADRWPYLRWQEFHKEDFSSGNDDGGSFSPVPLGYSVRFPVCITGDNDEAFEDLEEDPDYDSLIKNGVSPPLSQGFLNGNDGYYSFRNIFDAPDMTALFDTLPTPSGFVLIKGNLYLNWLEPITHTPMSQKRAAASKSAGYRSRKRMKACSSSGQDRAFAEGTMHPAAPATVTRGINGKGGVQVSPTEKSPTGYVTFPTSGASRTPKLRTIEPLRPRDVKEEHREI
jgi:hypothetical protein